MNVREHIVNKLIAAGGFWSYDEKSVRENMSDDQLIEAVLEKLDINDIDLLFQISPKNKIKAVWRERMVIQNDFYYSLNRFGGIFADNQLKNQKIFGKLRGGVNLRIITLIP